MSGWLWNDWSGQKFPGRQIELIPLVSGQCHFGGCADVFEMFLVHGACDCLHLGGVAEYPCNGNSGLGDTVFVSDFGKDFVQFGEFGAVDKASLKKSILQGGPCLNRDFIQSAVVDQSVVPVDGALRSQIFKGYDLQLNPGDKIFVYTDGVTEATDAGGELFGTDRMIEALNSCAEGRPEDILQGVRSSVDAFVGDAEQFDDLTMMCIEYLGPVPKTQD